MSAYTAGPWTVKSSGTMCYHVVSADSFFQTGCISFDGKGLANARLIAAAPELLAALKEIVSYNDDKNGLCWQDARAAIAKAEGP